MKENGQKTWKDMAAVALFVSAVIGLVVGLYKFADVRPEAIYGEEAQETYRESLSE